MSHIADGFQKCEGCDFKPCYDRENMIAIRDLYYKMENFYLEMLRDCSIYVDKIEQQQRNEKTIQNEEKIIFLLQQRINYAKNMATPDSVEDIKRMEEEISQSRYNIEMLKGQRLKDEEVKKMADSVVKVVNLISQEMKPKMISYCKSYMGWKSRHKRELLLEGQIRYIKYPDCNEKRI